LLAIRPDHATISAWRTKIEAERAGRFPILHVEPVLADTVKTNGHGPLSATRGLRRELVALCLARCCVSGCGAPVGRLVDTWRMRVQMPARDIAIVQAEPEA
jgi:hypothetical protein